MKIRLYIYFINFFVLIGVCIYSLSFIGEYNSLIYILQKVSEIFIADLFLMLIYVENNYYKLYNIINKKIDNIFSYIYQSVDYSEDDLYINSFDMLKKLDSIFNMIKNIFYSKNLCIEHKEALAKKILEIYSGGYDRATDLYLYYLNMNNIRYNLDEIDIIGYLDSHGLYNINKSHCKYKKFYISADVLRMRDAFNFLFCFNDIVSPDGEIDIELVSSDSCLTMKILNYDTCLDDKIKNYICDFINDKEVLNLSSDLFIAFLYINIVKNILVDNNINIWTKSIFVEGMSTKGLETVIAFSKADNINLEEV